MASHKKFKGLSTSTMIEICERETLVGSEISIFKVVAKWSEYKDPDEIQQVLIPFPLLRLPSHLVLLLPSPSFSPPPPHNKSFPFLRLYPTFDSL